MVSVTGLCITLLCTTTHLCNFLLKKITLPYSLKFLMFCSSILYQQSIIQQHKTNCSHYELQGSTIDILIFNKASLIDLNQLHDNADIPAFSDKERTNRRDYDISVANLNQVSFGKIGWGMGDS